MSVFIKYKFPIVDLTSDFPEMSSTGDDWTSDFPEVSSTIEDWTSGSPEMSS